MAFFTRQTRGVIVSTGLRRLHLFCRLLRSPFCWRFPGRSRRRCTPVIRLTASASWRREASSSPGTLFVFVASNIPHWLGSSVVRQWLWVMIVGTFGTVLLRPYYLVVGVPTTGVAWLMNRNDLLWAPRFFPAEALLWCITLVGFASVARAVPRSSERMRTALFTTSIVIAALSVSAQLVLVPWFARGGVPSSVDQPLLVIRATRG